MPSVLWELALVWGALWCLVCWTVPDRHLDTRGRRSGTVAGALLCALASPQASARWVLFLAAGLLAGAACAALWRRLRVARRRRVDPGYRPEEAEQTGETGKELLVHYDRTGDVTALDHGVELLRAAVRASGGHPAHTVHAANLVKALYGRYERLRDPADLDEAVETGRRVAHAVPDDPRRPALLSALSTALRLRHDHQGELADLDEAVALGEEATGALPERHADRAHCLGDLSVAYYSRFLRTERRKDLAAAVVHREEALHTTGEKDPGRVLHLVNLCHLLVERSRETGGAQDLERAVTLGRQAVERTAPGHRLHAFARSNLTLALRLRHTRLGNRRDLDEAVHLCEQALPGLPEDHPERPRLLSNLVLALRDRHGAGAGAGAGAGGGARAGSGAGGDGVAGVAGADLERALRLGREAAMGRDAGIGLRVVAGLAWADVAASAGEYGQAVEAFEQVIGLLPGLAAPDLRRADQEYQLGRWNGVAAAAAACAVAAGRPDTAALLLEKGRGLLLWRGLTERADLTALRIRHPELARELADVRAALAGVAELRTRPRALVGHEDRAVPEPQSSGGLHTTSATSVGYGGPAPVVEPDPRLGAVGPPHHPAQATGEYDGSAPDRLRGRHRELLARQDALLACIREEDGFGGFAREPGLEELVAEARQGPVVYLNVSGFGSQAIALTSTGVRVVPLPALTAEETVRQVQRFDSVMSSPSLTPEDQRTVADVLEWLWDAAAGPVLDALDLRRPGPPWPRVWWVPTGILSFLPIHAAGHHGTRDDPEPRTVLDRVVSSYTPTVRALAAARARPGIAGPPRPLAVAVPGETAVLRHARAEADSVGRLFGGSLVLVGAEATRERILAELPGRPWVHFACHGVTDLEDPSAGRLLLHGSEALSVADISRLELTGTELAYLSACDTAHPSLRLPDEAVHLAAAFQLAGFPQVLAALWPSHDRVTSGFAEDVYRRLASAGTGGHRPEAALAAHHATRAARLAYPNFPGLWAGYVHMGV